MCAYGLTGWLAAAGWRMTQEKFYEFLFVLHLLLLYMGE